MQTTATDNHNISVKRIRRKKDNNGLLQKEILKDPKGKKSISWNPNGTLHIYYYEKEEVYDETTPALNYENQPVLEKPKKAKSSSFSSSSSSFWYTKMEYAAITMEVQTTLVLARGGRKVKKSSIAGATNSCGGTSTSTSCSTTATIDPLSTVYCTFGLEHLIDPTKVILRQQRKQNITATVMQAQYDKDLFCNGSCDVSTCLPALYHSISLRCLQEAQHKANLPLRTFTISAKSTNKPSTSRLKKKRNHKSLDVATTLNSRECNTTCPSRKNGNSKDSLAKSGLVW